jgi:hypothetical protein
LREYKETYWIPVLPDGGFPEETFIFPDFKELDGGVEKLLKVVTDLHILIPNSADSFIFQGRPIGRARWHAAILRLNQKPRLRFNAARRDELQNFLITVDRWMTNLEKLPRSANPGHIETILEDLVETIARHGTLQLKDLPGVQDSA